MFHPNVDLQDLTPKSLDPEVPLNNERSIVIPAEAGIQRNTGPMLLITCYSSLFFHPSLITVFRPNELNQGYGFEKEG